MSPVNGRAPWLRDILTLVHPMTQITLDLSHPGSDSTTQRFELLEPAERNRVRLDGFEREQEKQPTTRDTSIDLLRGFALFWILGADEIASIFRTMAADRETLTSRLAGLVGSQLEHAEWEGFRFYDLILPLFIFVTGVSLVFSLSIHKERHGKSGAQLHVIRRALILYALGVIYYGGFSQNWPDIRLLGVLQRIALCYLIASILFLNFSLRSLALIVSSLLVGYWALLALMPVPGAGETAYLPEQNLANWIDRNYLPGRLWFTTWDPEGLLSTLPAVATCLIGVFAGIVIKNARRSTFETSMLLMVAGTLVLVGGYAWSFHFPIIKNIWTSSFVLVAGGYSLLLLGIAQLVVVGWRTAGPVCALVWLGANAITLYMINNFIGFSQLATRAVGGDISSFLDAQFSPGSGRLAVCVVGLTLAFLLARFLYRRRIFLRV